MAYYAKINEENIVIDLIVADKDHIDSGINGNPNMFKQVEEDSVGMGWHYVPEKNIFYEPQPFNSWTLNEIYEWQPPVAYPDDGEYYSWNEETLSWVAMSDCCNGQK